ncbi:hypothetical protein [Luteibacter sp. 9133]|uniref:hypothetical protein n=1 Tax=Luteibacter sp. 9133 TaxID=1500891 RepID=UPI00068DB4DC|nr:hypothetical protein [Luteibacter sp. 9133]
MAIANNIAGSRVNSILLAVVCAVGLALTAAAYYPGLMTQDSDFQLLQAQSFEFGDWHPPVMSLVWSGLLWIHDGPVTILGLFLVGYWASFCVISQALARRSAFAAWLIVIFAFTPVMINFVGTIWKDVFLVIGFLVTCAVVIRAHFRGVRLHRLTAAILVLLVAASVCARHNAIFTGLALTILILCYTFNFPRDEWRGMLKAAVVGTLLYVGAFGAMHAAITTITKPKETYPSSQLFLYDLVGISLRTHQWLLPPSANYNLANLPACYEDKGWDLIWLRCEDLIDDLRATGEWEHLGRRWISAIVSHPAAYAAHRASYFNSWFRKSDNDHLFVGSSKKSREYGFEERSAYLLMKKYVLDAAALPVMKPLFVNNTWVLLNIMMTGLYAVEFTVRRRREAFLPLFISLSGMLYTAPLIFGGVAPDFRYIYWGIAAALVCIATSIAIRRPAATT